MTKISAKSALASTIGLEISELKEYEYQHGRTARSIYAVGDWYFCAGMKPPREPDMKWERHPDQFWAERAGTVVWQAHSGATSP
jgi:hypothetical protein